MTNLIEKNLKEHIDEENAFFVFPTQIAADMWADKIIEVSDTKAVAMERFLAWDDFKGKSIKTSQKDKKSIPGTMRKIFADILLEENKKAPFLKTIILPQYIKYSKSFSSNVAKILPSLKLWKSYFDKSKKSYDDQDYDLEELYDRYKNFLDENNLFDPAWEEPPFQKDGNHYYIFFPEILSDYSEYKKILEGSKEDITVITFDDLSEEENNELKNQKINFYSDSRSEIKNLCLYLRKIHADGIEWNEIAVNVPDMDTYGPYIERDFDLHEIPYLSRHSKSLTSYRSGLLFKNIQQCLTDNFSFESIKKLLLNTNFPWKNKNTIQSLINFGKENNCITSYNYQGEFHDVWLESFKNAQIFNPNDQRINSELKSFYLSFKNSLQMFVNAKSFEEIKKAYFKFKIKFFNPEEFLSQADLILSRQISELCNLIDLENEFSAYKVSSPFSFFISHLESLSYLEQTKMEGVKILDYKTAACAPFKCHVIVDGSQKSLSIIYSKINFLREDKREALNITDENLSDAFVKLYAMNAQEIYFSVSAKNFKDYSQSYASFDEIERSKTSAKNYQRPDYSEDIIKKEKEFILEGKEEFLPSKIYQWQKESLDEWNEKFLSCKDFNFSAKEEVKVMLENSSVYKKTNEAGQKSLSASASSLKNYKNCPRYFLFKQALKLKEEDNDGSLLDKYTVGEFYHLIFENYMNLLKEKNLKLYIENESLTEEYEDILKEAYEKAFLSLKKSYLTKEELFSMKEAIFALIKKSIEEFSNIFYGYRIYGAELAFSIFDQEKNFIFEGKSDLILQDSSSDEFCIVDYKSSSIPQNLIYTKDDSCKKDASETEEAKKDDDEKNNGSEDTEEMENENLELDLQMPSYIYLLENNHDERKTSFSSYEKMPGSKIESAVFYNIKKFEATAVFGKKIHNVIHPKSKKDFYDREDFNDSMEIFYQQKEDFRKKVSECDFSVDEKIVTNENCLTCSFKSICRRTFTVAKR